LKSNDPGNGGAASKAQGVGGHDLGANNGASEDSADGESRGSGEDTNEENQVSSNDNNVPFFTPTAFTLFTRFNLQVPTMRASPSVICLSFSPRT
jgi:hypothetical protein